MSKTVAQLDREIADAEREVVGGQLTARRARDFRDSGIHELVDGSGVVVARMFRDPGDREWYEEGMPGAAQTHYTERWRGSTRAEAIANITRRRGLGR